MLVKNQDYDAQINGKLFTVCFPKPNTMTFKIPVNGERQRVIENIAQLQDAIKVSVGGYRRIVRFKGVTHINREYSGGRAYLFIDVAFVVESLN